MVLGGSNFWTRLAIWELPSGWFGWYMDIRKTCPAAVNGVLCWIGKDCEDGLRRSVDDRGRADTIVGHVATSS
jgi:hypothetical protein